MVVELLEDKKRWDQFVDTSPQGSLFHKWDFLKTVERHSTHKFLPYGVSLEGELQCIFPFFVRRNRRLTFMYSPPWGAQVWYLGPAFDPSVLASRASAREKHQNDVTGELCNEIDKLAPNSTYFTTVPNFLDVRSFMWKNFTLQLDFTCAIDLEKPLEEIWASFSRRCRQRIKQLNAYSPQIEQTQDVRALLAIWRPRFAELGMAVPLPSDNYLKDLVAAFPQDITVYNLSVDGRLATAMACCVMQKGRYGWWIGGVNVRKDLSVVDYLVWELVKRAKSAGFKKLDMGNPGRSMFKSKFDPILEPVCFASKVDTLSRIASFSSAKLAGVRLRVSEISRWRARRGLSNAEVHGD